MYRADNLSNIRRFVEQIYPNATNELERPNTFEEFGNSLDSEGFSKEEIAKKLSARTIGNETANIVHFSNIKNAENLLQVQNNEKMMEN